jgi:uncharacterized damage-inducible protein DinB
MPISDALLAEFDHETAATRNLLARVPDARAGWKPHEKSRSLGELATHLAHLVAWVPVTLKRTEFDTNPVDGETIRTPPFQSTARLLQSYDDDVKLARSLLTGISDGELMVTWSLKSAGKTMFVLPRVAVFRSFVMNHTIHHRGQLTVYLRMCDVPLPALYGPTADSIMDSGL